MDQGIHGGVDEVEEAVVGKIELCQRKSPASGAISQFTIPSLKETVLAQRLQESGHRALRHAQFAANLADPKDRALLAEKRQDFEAVL
jgi:hypothetical protein